MNPPHVSRDPIVIVSTVCRLVREIRYIALNPCIGIGPDEVPVKLPQLLNESDRTQIAITLRVDLHCTTKAAYISAVRGMIISETKRTSNSIINLLVSINIMLML